MGFVCLWVTTTTGGFACRTATSLQREAAERLRPKGFEPRRMFSPPYEKIRIRVHASEAHQRVIFGWQVRFLDTIERANAYLGPTAGLELEVTRARPWKLEIEPTDLEAGARLLMGHDPGQGTDLVVGLFSPLPAMTSAIHRLGLANLLGRHMILRTFDSVEEMSVLKRRFPGLEPEEVERLYVARRVHAEVQLILHELGHMLGALHVRDIRSILYPNLDARATGYASETVQLMRRGLGLLRDPGPANLEAYRTYLAASTWNGWLAGERDRMVAFMAAGRTTDRRGLPDRALLDPTAVAESPVGRLRPRAEPRTPAEAAREALARAGRGELETGWAMVEALAEKAPSDPDVVGVACRLAARAAPEEADRWCEAAGRLSPDEPRPGVLRAYAALRRDAADTARLAQRAEAQLAKTATVAEETWALLAQVYRGISWVTAAERVAAHGGDTEEAYDVAQWAKRVRSIYDLPVDSAERGVPEAAEAAYVRRRAEVLRRLPGARPAAASRLVARFEQRYPRMPPLSLALCETLVRDGRYASAERVCRRAARRFPRDARVHFALGAVAFARGNPREAIAPLERALELRPDRKDGYTLLWSAYRVTGRPRDARRLAARYAARFKEPLPGSGG